MVASERAVNPPVALPPPSAEAGLPAWLAWLEARHGKQIDLSLERCREVAGRLNIGRPAPIVITVAGTNGKGSSVAMLESIYINAGYRVGTYTSPHLLRFNERMRINGRPLDDMEICRGFDQVERERHSVSLTYFEFSTLAALALFQQAKLDILILEVGLGGRLDAVNIIDPDVALIAAIGLDHEDWLGETREAIGREKAGIMRPGVPVVCSDHAVPASIPQCASEVGAELELLGADFTFDMDPATGQWRWWSGADAIDCLPVPALCGNHQLRNAAGVIKVVRLLARRVPVSSEQIKQGLVCVQLHGRFHAVRRPHQYIMDVAHNPQAAEIFRATLGQNPTSGKTFALIGMLNTKNHIGYLRPLTDVVDRWCFTDLPAANGARATELESCLKKLMPRAWSRCFDSVAAAHEEISRQASPDDRVLVLGSSITVGAMLKIFESLQLEID